MKDKINAVISDLKEAVAYLEYASDLNHGDEFKGKIGYAEMYIHDAIHGILSLQEKPKPLGDADNETGSN